jgi:hypothetical protein
MTIAEDQPPASRCRFVERCAMFPLFVNDFGLKVFKTTYCHASAHQRCHRYKLAISGTMPDPDLLPNGRRLVRAE